MIYKFGAKKHFVKLAPKMDIRGVDLQFAFRIKSLNKVYLLELGFYRYSYLFKCMKKQSIKVDSMTERKISRH